MSTSSKRRRATVLAIAASALLAAGCGSGEPEQSGGEAAPAASEAAATAKKDGILAANRAQGNEIIEGGKSALNEKLAGFEQAGKPVLVNQWASWCPPCRAEFPYFQDAAERYARDVAFLGIDMQDNRDNAEAFLTEFPVPYPSIFDPDASAITSIGGGLTSPTTVYITADGEQVYVFQGAYTSQAELDADIKKYLL